MPASCKLQGPRAWGPPKTSRQLLLDACLATRDHCTKGRPPNNQPTQCQLSSSAQHHHPPHDIRQSTSWQRMASLFDTVRA